MLSRLARKTARASRGARGRGGRQPPAHVGHRDAHARDHDDGRRHGRAPDAEEQGGPQRHHGVGARRGSPEAPEEPERQGDEQPQTAQVEGGCESRPSSAGQDRDAQERGQQGHGEEAGPGPELAPRDDQEGRGDGPAHQEEGVQEPREPRVVALALPRGRGEEETRPLGQGRHGLTAHDSTPGERGVFHRRLCASCGTAVHCRWKRGSPAVDSLWIARAAAGRPCATS